MYIKRRIINIFFMLFLTSFFIPSCRFTDSPIINKGDNKVLLAAYETQIGQSKQILLLQKERAFPFSKYFVYALEKKNDRWNLAFGPLEAVIGKNGFAPSGKKREGDGKTPSGIFLLKRTFGYNKFISSKMPYQQVLEDDLWVDDPEDSSYNQWVKENKTKATSFEKMRRTDNQYKYGIVIEYNTDPVIKSHGSAIFFHVWKAKSSSTAGCVAVSEENLVKILAWLDPSFNPLIIMGISEEDDL